MDIFLHFVLPALCGVFIGILSGMLGIGGGTVMVPLFRLLFGMSPLMSTATSLFAIIPTSIAGAVAHIRAKTLYLPLGLALGIGGALTSPIGVWLSSISESWMVMLVAALVIGYSAINMLVKAAKMKPAKKPGTSTETEVSKTNTDQPAKDVTRQTTARTEIKLDSRKLLLGAVIGLCAGLISGYVGVGGGFIMVPLMISIIGIPMTHASGTSLIAVTILAIPGVIEHGFMSNIDYFAGLIVAVGSIPGAILGAKLVQFIPERTLRFIFGGFLVVAAILLAINEF